MRIEEIIKEPWVRYQEWQLRRRIEAVEERNRNLIERLMIEESRIQYQRVSMAPLTEELQAAYYKNEAERVREIAARMIQSEAGAVVYHETLIRCYRTKLGSLRKRKVD